MASRKGFFGSTGSIGVVLLVLAIVGLVNVIASRRFARLDLTQNREYTITKSTKSILAGLDDVVNVTVYFSKELPPYLATLDRQVKDILDEYKAYSGGKLRIQFEDPGDDPTKLPRPDALVPLYRHLIAGQTKADSDALIDAQAWLAGLPCATSLRP